MRSPGPNYSSFSRSNMRLDLHASVTSRWLLVAVSVQKSTMPTPSQLTWSNVIKSRTRSLSSKADNCCTFFIRKYQVGQYKRLSYIACSQSCASSANPSRLAPSKDSHRITIHLVADQPIQKLQRRVAGFLRTCECSRGAPLVVAQVETALPIVVGLKVGSMVP